MESSYLTSAQKASQLPYFSLPEIAILGRSNCGKSSLINALLDRKNLARSSSTPGRTRNINFFTAKYSKEKNLIIADLPGHGFNKAPKEIQKSWGELIDRYILRDNLRGILYLCDSRRKMTQEDYTYLRYLSGLRPLTLVLTKVDKSKRQELAKQVQEHKKDLYLNGVKADLHTVSVLKRVGIAELREGLFTAYGGK